MSNEMQKFDDIHEEVWDTLPWYVNGTVDAKERAMVEAHLEHCDACRKEVSTQKRLAKAMAERSGIDAVEDANWARLMGEVDADFADASRAMGNPVGEPDNADADNDQGKATIINLNDVRARRTTAKPQLKNWMYSGLVAASMMMAVFFVASDYQTGSEFRTLTETETLDGADLIRIKAAEGFGGDAMKGFLKDHGALIVEGPSPTGVYTIKADNGVDPAGLYAAMKLSQQVVFASRLQGE